MSAAPDLATALTRADKDDAPSLEPTYTAGLSDALGDRLICFTGPGVMSLELLRFKPELGDAPGFEPALRATVGTIGRLDHPALTTVRSVERAEEIEGLALISVRESGRRLSELIPRARGTAYAVELIREIGPALAVIHEAGHVHGALTPDRIIVSREGHPIVVEHVLGAALTALAYPAARLRAVAGVAVPEVEGPPRPLRIDARLDVIQLGFIAVSLLIGQRLSPADYPSRIIGPLDQFSKSDPEAAAELRPWLERALQIAGRPFANATDALAAFQELPDALLSKPVEAPPPDQASSKAPAPPPPALVAAPKPDVPARPASPASEEKRDLKVVPAAVSREPAKTPEPEPKVKDTRVESPGLFGAPPAPDEASRRMSYIRWAAVAFGVVIVVQTVIIGYLYVSGLSTETTSLVVSNPAPVNPPPMPQVPPAAPTPTSIVENTGAPAPAAPPVQAPEGDPAASDPAAAAARFGGFTIRAPFELQIFQGDRLLGTTAGPIAIPAGSHTLDLVNDELGFRARRTVTVLGGQMASVAIPVPNGRININAVPWADVWIDGTSAGQTPLANLELAIGRHEIIFRHPQFGERTETVVVKVDGITRVSAVFQQ